MSNNANLVKKLVNNSWDKPVMTIKQATEYLTNREQIVNNIEHYMTLSENAEDNDKRVNHIQRVQFFQQQLVILDESVGI